MTSNHLRDAKWVKRNEDKPHRCPKCHAIAVRAWANAMDGTGHGPRTIYSCCGVKWRVGSRLHRTTMRFRQIVGLYPKAARWR